MTDIASPQPSPTPEPPSSKPPREMPPVGTVIKSFIVDVALLLYLVLAVLFISQVFIRSYDLLDRNGMFSNDSAPSESEPIAANGKAVELPKRTLNFGDYLYYLFARGIERRNLDHFTNWLAGAEPWLDPREGEGDSEAAATASGESAGDGDGDDGGSGEAPPFLFIVIGVLVGTFVWTGLGLVNIHRTLAQRLFGIHAPPPPPADRKPTPWWRTFNGLAVLGVLLTTVFTGWFMIEVNLTNVFSDVRLSRMGAIFEELFDFANIQKNLDTAVDGPKSWDLFDDAIPRIVETVFLAMMATGFAIPIAFVLSFFGAQNLMSGSLLGKVTYYATRWVLNIIRSVEPLCWCIVASVWVGAGTFAGVLALAVHSIASLAKLYSEQIEGIDPGPLEAIRATGASTLQVVRFGVVPQIVPPFLSFTMYRWDINLRMAPILGFVGGGGIGVLLKQNFDTLNYANVGVIILLITLIVAAMDFTSARIRAKLI